MNLLLTLGHNSSAITTDEFRIVAGYEEERLNRIKSSSQFPQLSIEECLKNHENNVLGSQYLYVSHWFDDFDFHKNGFTDKHWNPHFVEELCNTHKLKLVTLNPQFTHHDAHAWAARAFYEAHSTALDPIHICVADGFGNKEEVFSVYKWNPAADTMSLVHRVYGYENSLGLLYQYATSYCGMKENQDEYKFLGYETHVHSVLDSASVAAVERWAHEQAEKMFDMMLRNSDSRGANWQNPNGLVNYAHLSNTKEMWSSIFGDVLSRVNIKRDDRSARIVIGHYVQELIERVMLRIAEENSVKHVILAGGIFYNVKLNNSILKNIDGGFCVVPVAGD